MIILTQRKSLKIGEILLHQGWIKPEELQAALNLQKDDTSKRLIGTILVDRGIISKNILFRALAMQFGKQFIELSKVKMQPQVLKMVSRQIALKYGIMPIAIQDGMLYIAMTDPLERKPCEVLKKLPGIRDVEIALALPEDIEETIHRYYGDQIMRLKMSLKQKLRFAFRYFTLREMTSF